MKLVIDTNRIIAALLRDSASRFLLLHPSLSFITPAHARTEINRHKAFLQATARLNEKDFDDVLDLLFSRITIENTTTYSYCLASAQKMLVDKDDAPFLALALSQNISIWSDDKHFQAQRLLKTYTTAELLRIIKKR